MAFIALKHEGTSRPRAEVNNIPRTRDITILYPVGMATTATLENKRKEKSRGYQLPLYAAFSNAWSLEGH